LRIGVDLGSKNFRIIAALATEMSPHPQIITGVVGEAEGIRQGRILDIPACINSLRRLVKKAEIELGEKIQNVNVAITGDFIKTKVVHTKATVAKASNEVTELDFENAKSEAVSQILPNSPFHILNTILSEVKLDGKKVRGSAMHQVGGIIEMKYILHLIPKKILEEYVEVFDELELNISELVISSVANYIPLTKRGERVAGVGVLNIGHDTTTFTYFENELPVVMKSWSVGGANITNDIALMLSTKIEDAEEIKKNFKNLNVKKVQQIINARVEDICDLVKNEIADIAPMGKIAGGVILTGGGSKIEDIELTLKKCLGMQVTSGNKILMSISKNLLKDSSWAVAYGLTYFDSKEKTFFQEMWEEFRNYFGKFLSIVSP
jgi:cell division protein FtsA